MGDTLERHGRTVRYVLDRADKILGDREGSVRDLLGLTRWEAFRLATPGLHTPRLLAKVDARLTELEAT
jgi:hypothetical protein